MQAWGGLMTARVKAKGTNGIVVDSLIRDLTDLSSKHLMVTIVVRPGDIIFGFRRFHVYPPKTVIEDLYGIKKACKKGISLVKIFAIYRIKW
ncbi:5259_t:CDS:2 [Funneliformis caledonium]|uniref:5259_t:CDS:1 n=1 Tax=Funneliformis caledonium TaxID=1117310 RepID=A0A9N9HAE5_9GLOM|nr:5259_t:CDS:2 [Funneliformis caledonium]